ncbi:guanylate kinase [Anaerosinus gibii]|uniref:Guanylate kinase n=1 Tax=Selenobaculum gibii TaxID=3054208 RepID=A0A9Y2AKP8_9FIRM|nr:guanylate kinase [Selenobaculum gbiensis]WIW71966.1 guanylate kinase [Selenobaculum gbiensis]
MEKLLLVLSGPSGTGKGTICKEILNKNKEIRCSISATTRSPRLGEINGVNYWFTSKKDFCEMIENDELLEWAEVYDNYYGTPIKKLQDMLKDNDVILEIDIQGALQIKKKFPNAVLIYILPPSIEELIKRLHDRGTDSLEVIEKRLSLAREEIAKAACYDYVVVNDKIELAVKKIMAIVIAERCNVIRNKILIRNISESRGESK